MATRLTAAMARVSASVIADRARWASTNTIIASEPALMPSSSAAVPRRPAHAMDERPRQRHEHECGQKNADGRRDRPDRAAEQEADERRGGEHGAWRDLPDRDGVEELLLGQPAEALDEIRAQERQQHVAAAEEHRARLQEQDEHQAEAERRCRRRRGSCQGSGGKHAERSRRARREGHGQRTADGDTTSS